MNNSGIIIVDKPCDISSAGVVRIIKKIFNASKAGHAGTLDPFATGVLVCCINKGTRLSNFFLNKPKKYNAVIHLGIATDTQDFTGKVVSVSQDTYFSEKELKAVFEKFIGRIDQIPPVYSALKHNGIPLYKLARKGCPVQKPARSIFISNIDILDIKLPEISFEISCSAGTYIRTLCADIGDYLGCGAHLKELRRNKSGDFSIQQAVSLSEIKQYAADDRNLSDFIINMSDALSWMPKFTADNELIQKIKHGKNIFNGDIEFGIDSSDFIKIVDNKNSLMSIIQRKKNSNTYKYAGVFI